jgi:uncharacterized protein (TIGR00251 family)
MINNLFKNNNNQSIEFFIHLSPCAKSNQILGIAYENDNISVTGILKIAIAAPPRENQANLELIQFLAKLFKIPKSSICIKQGMKSRRKLISISKVDEVILHKAVEPLLVGSI